VRKARQGDVVPHIPVIRGGIDFDVKCFGDVIDAQHRQSRIRLEITCQKIT
jgi:hypothetical protein